MIYAFDGRVKNLYVLATWDWFKNGRRQWDREEWSGRGWLISLGLGSAEKCSQEPPESLRELHLQTTKMNSSAQYGVFIVPRAHT